MVKLKKQDILRRLKKIGKKVDEMHSGCFDDGDILSQDIGVDVRNLISDIELSNE